MSKTQLHITNGDSLTNYLKDLGFTDDILTWREMLCEGPTVPLIDSEAFYNLRKTFLSENYGVDSKDYNLKSAIEILEMSDDFDDINLWFEYDLFCHINLIAVINLLHQKNLDDKPIYLVCSGRVTGEKDLKGLAELTPEQLKLHYQNRVKLTDNDIKLAIALWRTYCGKDHNIFKPYIVENSSFKYLTNCLKAHLKRFPDSETGLSTLETHILNLVKKNNIKSKDHLVVYCLNYQGYYGFGDIQFRRMINKLAIYFKEKNNRLKLNSKGKKILAGIGTFENTKKEQVDFGGVCNLDYRFSKSQNRLVKA